MRFLYAALVTLLWGYLISKSEVTGLVSNDTLLLVISIVFAGALAGGD